jgi:hypothetical protein
MSGEHLRLPEDAEAFQVHTLDQVWALDVEPRDDPCQHVEKVAVRSGRYGPGYLVIAITTLAVEAKVDATAANTGGQFP